MLLALGWLDPAAAQVEACPGPLPLDEWDRAMAAVDQALTDGDGARAERILDQIVYEMRCLDTVAPPEMLGRLARELSLVAFFAQDFDEMAYWAYLADEVVGEAPWPANVALPETYDQLVAELPAPEVVRADGGLLVPKGGGALLDGKLILEPLATDGAQHLLQLADKRGQILSTTWQTGAAFPTEALTPDSRPLTPPKWYVAPSVEPEPVEPEPVEPAPVDPEPDPVAIVPAEPPPTPPKPISFDGDGRTAACPWRNDPHVVEVHGHTIQVNKRVFDVRTDEQQTTFHDILETCGEFRAARRFLRWENARGKPFAGAHRYREALVEALLTDEPHKRPGR